MAIAKARADLARLVAKDEALNQKLEEIKAERAAVQSEMATLQVVLSWLEKNFEQSDGGTVQAARPAEAGLHSGPKQTDGGAIPSFAEAGRQNLSQDGMLPDLLPPNPRAPNAYLGISISTLREGFRAKSIADAAIVLLSLHGRPLTEAQLVEGLLAGGVTLIASKPISSLRFTLVKRSKETNAIRSVSGGRWALSTWTNIDAPLSTKTSGGPLTEAGGDHVENARRGLQAAAQRGVKLGRPAKFPPEVVQAALEMIAEGVPIRQVSRQLGINATTIGHWKDAKDAADKEALSKMLPGSEAAH